MGLKNKNMSRTVLLKIAADSSSRSVRRPNKNVANWRSSETESAKRSSKRNRGSKRSNGVGPRKKRRQQQLENAFRISARAWAAKHLLVNSREGHQVNRSLVIKNHHVVITLLLVLIQKPKRGKKREIECGKSARKLLESVLASQHEDTGLLRLVLETTQT